jgi:osmotically-inducible protein OsmY
MNIPHRIALLGVVAVAAVATVPTLAAEADPAADAAITAKVQAALAADRRLEVREPLQVRTRGGVVELIGEAESASMVYRAVETARNVEGVKDVDTHRLEAR